MAKTIKFNLICDNKPVRTVEDLRENFSIEDVLKYYENGLLIKWLEARGYEEEREEVVSIQDNDKLNIIKSLIKIFKVESDEKKIAENVYVIQHVEEQKELYELYKVNNFKVKQVIDDYQCGYCQLVDEIIKKPNDVALVKANIKELTSNYEWPLKLDHRELFYNLYYVDGYTAIMCLLMNEKTRKYYLPCEVESDDTEEVKYDIENNYDKRRMYEVICQLVIKEDFVTCLGENLHIFAGVTDDYWKDLEARGKKYMIINMGKGDFVRAAGVQGGDMSSTDVVNNFVIVDGIDYKSNSATRQLWYMEV